MPQACLQRLNTQIVLQREIFDPWTGLNAHRPLGHLNSLRRDAYRRARANREIVRYPIPDKWADDMFVGEPIFASNTPCSECCRGESGEAGLCQYARYPRPFDGLPSKVAHAASLGTERLISM